MATTRTQQQAAPFPAAVEVPDLDILFAEVLYTIRELQPSEHPSPAEAAKLVVARLHKLGGAAKAAQSCAAVMATDFGDHPTAALERMRWALRVVKSRNGDNP